MACPCSLHPAHRNVYGVIPSPSSARKSLKRLHGSVVLEGASGPGYLDEIDAQVRQRHLPAVNVHLTRWTFQLLLFNHVSPPAHGRTTQRVTGRWPDPSQSQGTRSAHSA